jgi:predicted HTH domain antitoxin
MSITLELPDGIDEAEARRELAIALYREGKLPPGRAASLAGMDRWDFDALLFERRIPFPMNEAELVKEVRNALRRR